MLSLCLYSLEFRPKNNATFKSKNVNTFIYVLFIHLQFELHTAYSMSLIL